MFGRWRYSRVFLEDDDISMLFWKMATSNRRFGRTRSSRNELHALPPDMDVTLPSLEKLELYANRIEWLGMPEVGSVELVQFNRPDPGSEDMCMHNSGERIIRSRPIVLTTCRVEGGFGWIGFVQ